MKQVVTHPGAAHRDDLLAVAIALAHYGCVPVFRRDPTEEELRDPDVLVLDCGGRHEPEVSNFDHHQLPRDAEAECALSLFVRYLGLEAEFKLQPWWEITKVLDAKGPFVAAKALGLDKLPEELSSPVEGTLTRWFASEDRFDCWGYGDTPGGEAKHWHPLLEALWSLGQQLLADVKAYADMYARIRELVRVVEVDDLDCFIGTEVLSPTLAAALNRFRDLEHPQVAVSIMKSDRDGESWVLYRYDDHPRVDFSRLSGDQVVFAHKSGFVAKLAPDVGEAEALEFVQAALV